MRPGRVAIVGAGPAGLAAAACLKRRGIDHLLLERGAGTAAGLRRVDPAMHLLSPTPFNRLPGMKRSPELPFYPTFSQYVGLLEDYAEAHRLRVDTGRTVTRIQTLDGRFVVETPDDAIEATHVINATGIVSSPKLPDDFDPASLAIPWKHSTDVRTGDLVGVNRLLVVGGGASAAEVLDRWLDVRENGEQAWLSLRSRLFAFRNPILGLDVHYWIWLPERLPAARIGWRPRQRWREAMNGTQVLPAIERGIIVKRPRIERYLGDRVVFESGETAGPELIVFATGYRYDVTHLRGLFDQDPDGQPRVIGCRITRTPRLYLLGYKFGRTFASPYIRGIARDARIVARHIARDLS